MFLENTELSEGKYNSRDSFTGDNFTKEIFGSYFLANIDITTQGPV